MLEIAIFISKVHPKFCILTKIFIDVGTLENLVTIAFYHQQDVCAYLQQFLC